MPYIFADYWRFVRGDPACRAAAPLPEVDTRGRPYRTYLWLLAVVPMLGLLFSFREVQKVYAVFGALFMPLLALTLLYLNGRVDWVGPRFRNGAVITVLLAAIVVLFLFFGALQLRAQLGH